MSKPRISGRSSMLDGPWIRSESHVRSDGGHPDATIPESLLMLTRVVEEYRVWLKTDANGSWVSLHDALHAERDWATAELWGAYATREEALRAVWEGTLELRTLGLDRRKRARRRWSRPWADRRARLDAWVWSLTD